MQVDLAATNSLSSSPRFWTAITQSVFRLKENSWLADEMTCFCLCHRRVAAADAAVALEKRVVVGTVGREGGWNLLMVRPPPTFRVNGKTTSLTPLGVDDLVGQHHALIISKAAEGTH